MEDLHPEQVKQLGHELERLRQELMQSLEATEEASRPVDLGQPIGRVTRIDAIQQQRMAQAGRRALEVRLGQVGAALMAIASGDYGICRRCEEPIGFARLKVRPESLFCVDCQGSVEKKG